MRVGEALVRAAEAWTRVRGWRRLTLGVFQSNTRAGALYERLGYGIDTLRLVKVLEAEEELGE
jgi:ribosomal protein S18 acetylase RimI-like enzyme